MSNPADTKGYTVVGTKPLSVPRTGSSGWIDNSNVKGDSARYILTPDDEFARPWLGIPGKPGVCFVWPLGTEGFTVAIDPALGIHKYLGDNQVDVQVVHVGQENITLTGTFPGQGSNENMNALRDICLRQSPERGKVLHLPLVLPKYQYVIVEHAEFDHAEGDMYQDIHYSISFIKVGTGKKASTKPPSVAKQNPSTVVKKKQAKGNSTHFFRVTGTVNTLRKIAKYLGRGDNGWKELFDKNKAYFIKNGIATHLVPDKVLPIGMKVFY